MNTFSKCCLFFLLQEHKPITSEFVCLLCLLCSVRSTLSCQFLLYRSFALIFFSVTVGKPFSCLCLKVLLLVGILKEFG